VLVWTDRRGSARKKLTKVPGQFCDATGT